MFYKSPRIWITGELFLPSKVIDVIGICFDDFFDFGSIENHKLQRKNSYGCGIIEVPSNIIFEKNNE